MHANFKMKTRNAKPIFYLVLGIDRFLLRVKFVKCLTEHGVYVNNSTTTKMVSICLYVDDLLVTGDNEAEIAKFKRKIMCEFETTNLRNLSYFLCMEFVTTKNGIFLHQRKHAIEVLKRFHMWGCNSAPTPVGTRTKLIKDMDEPGLDVTMYRQLIGSLRYL